MTKHDPFNSLINPAIRDTNLVVEPDIREAHLHQPLKHGHLQVEVFGKLVHGGTGAQLKKHYRFIICSKVSLFYYLLLRKSTK